MTLGRIAHAVRGLKFGCRFHFVPMFQSHRSRGAWIEISLGEVELYPPPGRIAHAVRGLKYVLPRHPLASLECRIAHAVRGLKYGRHSVYHRLQ